MDGKTIEWLLGNDNPAVRYRTQTELLGIEADPTPVVRWMLDFLPADWEERRGLWYIYYLTALAECGLTSGDFPLDERRALLPLSEGGFDLGCAGFMYLRAMVMLGFANRDPVRETILSLGGEQFPDGGFLCLHRIKKLKYTPKSCVKANNTALLFCAECRRRGIETGVTDGLLKYYWNHNVFYKTADLTTPMLDARPGWRTTDVFYPFEPMRVGLINIAEAFAALGCGNDPRAAEVFTRLGEKTDSLGSVTLEGTLKKSYLPRERVGKPSKWATFYTELARRERAEDR